MKFLITGLGSIGRRHLRNLMSLGEEDIVLLRSGKSTLPDDDLSEFVTEIHLEAALAHKPDAVIVSNPTAHHLDIAIPAAQAGSHLLLEKPISHSLERVDELKKAVKVSGSRVLVGYQFRFHPGLKAIKEWLSEGRIGRLLYARAHKGEYLPDWHPWEDYRSSYASRGELGGGVLLTLSHPLDYMRWLLGEVKSVSGWTTSSGALDIDVADIADLQLEFENDVVVSVHLDYLQRPPDHHVIIIGSEGSCRWDEESGIASRFDVQRGIWTASKPDADFDRNWMFMDEMRNFIRMIQGEEILGSSLADGIRVLEMVSSVEENSSE